MLSAFLYILLGVCDAFAMLLLVLKLYMMPVLKYRNRIVLFVLFIAVFSYLIRIVLGVPKFDLPLQYLLFVIFLRFGMGIKLHLGAFISGAGINAYIALQLAFYFLLNLLGSTNTNTLSQNTGSTVFTLQIITILAAVLIATLFKLFNLGFSFIFSPPHDFLIKENYMTKTNKMMISGAVISLVTISLTLYLLYNLNAIGTLIMTSITFAVSYYMSDRSDYEDVREAVEAYREKNKRN
ncbi:hypothetical protein MKX59_19215 [Paenibacillus sp. FSL R7-0340]|uniref:hypothetical protein n=1 Tax=Paenibacillus sp. FSL R7-0340 TaxID=2921684 RepID=UPI0030F667B9